MAIENTRPMLFSEIIAEFGGDPPHLFSEYYKNGGIVDSDDIAPNVPTSGPMLMSQFLGAARNEIGQTEYTVPGRYTFTVPDGVRSVCCVTVGGGGDADARAGGGGGALAWKNAIAVSPGDTLEVEVAEGGVNTYATRGTLGARAGASSFGSYRIYDYTWAAKPSSSVGLVWDKNEGTSPTTALYTSGNKTVKGTVAVRFYHLDFSAKDTTNNGYVIQHSINDGAWATIMTVETTGNEGVTEGQTWVSRNYGTTDVLVKYRILPYDIAGTANYIRIGHVRLDVDRFCAAQGGAHSTNNQDTGGLGGVKIVGDGGGSGGKGGNAGSGTSAAGAGAGGYEGNGGDGGSEGGHNGNPGLGGAGGGGYGPTYGFTRPGSSSGGGVGIYGKGTSGPGGTSSSPAGKAGSSGQNGIVGATPDITDGAAGVNFGSGAGGNGSNNTGNRVGGNGAVRVIWGFDRAYPATRTANEVGA